MSETDSIDRRLKQLREILGRIAEESAREAERHLQEDEASLEFPFHDGERGSFQLALNYLGEAAAKGLPVSQNAMEEVYVSLLASYKRMKGSAAALKTIIRMMRDTFDLRTEEEMEQALK